MSALLEKIKSSALQLSVGERAELASLLLRSLDTATDEDAEAAWDAELTRREVEIRDGKVQGELADVVMTRILANLVKPSHR